MPVECQVALSDESFLHEGLNFLRCQAVYQSMWICTVSNPLSLYADALIEFFSEYSHISYALTIVLRVHFCWWAFRAFRSRSDCADDAGDVSS